MIGTALREGRLRFLRLGRGSTWRSRGTFWIRRAGAILKYVARASQSAFTARTIGSGRLWSTFGQGTGERVLSSTRRRLDSSKRDRRRSTSSAKRAATPPVRKRLTRDATRRRARVVLVVAPGNGGHGVCRNSAWPQPCRRHYQRKLHRVRLRLRARVAAAGAGCAAADAPGDVHLSGWKRSASLA